MDRVLDCKVETLASMTRKLGVSAEVRGVCCGALARSAVLEVVGADEAAEKRLVYRLAAADDVQLSVHAAQV